MKNISRLIVTGATGNTGFNVLSRLRKRHSGVEIVAFVRPNRDVSTLKPLNLQIVEIDFDNPQILSHYVNSDDVFVEMANLRYARSFLPVLIKSGVRRAFCITTTAVFSKFHTYAASYNEIEEFLSCSSVDVTILRPSMIYGNEKDKNIHRLLKFMDRSYIFPIFGSGKALMQPVHVFDLAEGIVSAIEKDARGSFNLAGPIPISYLDLLHACSKALGKNINFIHLPHGAIAASVKVLQNFPGFPLRYEQVMRLLEDKSFNIDDSISKLSFSPRDFSQGIDFEVSKLRNIGLVR